MQNRAILTERGFGSYTIINKITIAIDKISTTTETMINLNNYINDFMCQNGKYLNYNKHGIANITVTGNWSQCKLITGTQVINQLENNQEHIQNSNMALQFNIPAIPFCKTMDYFIFVEGGDTVYLSIDIVEFDKPFNFDNSHINSPESYYVVKVNVSNGINNGRNECVNYLRFMSKCVGLAY